MFTEVLPVFMSPKQIPRHSFYCNGHLLLRYLPICLGISVMAIPNQTKSLTTNDLIQVPNLSKSKNSECVVVALVLTLKTFNRACQSLAEENKFNFVHLWMRPHTITLYDLIGYVSR